MFTLYVCIYICKRLSPYYLFKILRPPALPRRLQRSTIGRTGLNRRVRYGNGCVPGTHHHRKFSICHRQTNSNATCLLILLFLRKEVIQPHLPIRLPCYDFTPVTGTAFDGSFLAVRPPASGISDSHGVTGEDPGTYSPQHSDLRLLAIPASCSRVADYSPNWDGLFGIRSASRLCISL